MDRLLQGYRRFRADVWPTAGAHYEALADDGQRPETLLISCSDSRVDPQAVFGAKPGEMFVVRNVAGLVPPYQPDVGCHGTSAAIEYGVRVLGVSHIVVLGHAQCGGVRAVVEGAPPEARDFVEPWMAIAKPILRRPSNPDGGPNLVDHYESEMLKLSLANLATFPWINEAVEAKRLQLHGFHFDIRTGTMSALTGDRWVSVV
jgi:carbonic anhydrase